ncbi:MAG: hypothetical protein AB7T63_14930 [Planctomycetota bacterium]
MASSKSKELQVHTFLSLFLDILGWGQQLLDFDGVAEAIWGPEETERRVLQPLQQLGVLERTVRAYVNLESPDRWEPDPRLANLGPAEQERYRQLTQRRILLQSLNDCFILSTPFTARRGGMPALESLIAQVALALPMLLAQEVPVRGAIAAGIGLEHRGQIIGSSVVRSYKIESEVAGFPRVVIDRGLVPFVHEVASEGPDDVDRNSARRALGWLFVDQDGQVAVDYFGAHALEFYGWMRSPEMSRAVRQAYGFVRAQRQAAKSAGQAKHLAKWDAVRDYFRSRLPREVLGLPALEEQDGVDQ